MAFRDRSLPVPAGRVPLDTQQETHQRRVADRAGGDGVSTQPLADTELTDFLAELNAQALPSAISKELRRAIMCGNAVDLYGFGGEGTR